jgi:hypothetical protein
MATVTAIKGFGYPKDLVVRAQIRDFHKVKKNDGLGWDGDRGEIVEVAADDVIEAPTDLLDSWLAAELVLLPITGDGDPLEDEDG